MNKLFSATTILALSTLSAPAAEKPNVTVLRAARLFDGESGALVTNGVVVVEGDRIAAAGSGIAAPPGAAVVDLGDATLLPGFVDAHVHLGGEMSENWYKDFYEESLRQPGERALWAALYARRTLEAGFTTVRNLGDHDYVDVGLRNAITAGIAAGPRMLVAVHSLGPAGGHGDGTPWPPEVPQKGPRQGVCNGAAECREAVRLQIKYGADVIKCMPSGGVLSLADSVDLPQMTQDEMTALVDEAHQWGRKVAAHCHGDAAARIAIKAGVDSLEHGSFIKPDTLALMKEKGVFLVATLMAGEWTGGKAERFPPAIAVKARAALAARSEMFRNALKAGVKIAFGTDSGVSPHGLNAKEFALMTGLGMTPAAALRAAGAGAAELLGLTEKIGTLEKGKLADVVAVPGDPLADIRATERVLFVMKDGKVVKDARK